MDTKKLMMALGTMSVVAAAVPFAAKATQAEKTDSQGLVLTAHGADVQNVNWHSSHGSHTSHSSHSSSRW